jgi:hypothetical protein
LTPAGRGPTNAHVPTDLAALLVEEGSVSTEDLERATARQREAGGALDTALLELELLPESVLAAALSRATGLPAAPPAAWAAGDPRARRVFPSRVAERHGLAPFALEGRELALVATNPVDLGLLDEISFMLSLHLTAHVGPEWRVRTLIHRLYGGALEPRFAALAARAGDPVEAPPPEAPAAAPPSAEPEQSFTLADPPADEDETSFADAPAPRARPGGFARDASEPLEPLAAALAQALESDDLAGLFEDEPPEPAARAGAAGRGEPEAGAEETDEVEAEPAAPPDRSAPPRWSLDDARAALAAARDRDAVVLAALRYARDFFELAAVFAVTRDAVAGHDALGRDPDTRELCRGVAIYATDPGICRTVIETSAPHLGPIPREAPGNAAILDGLGRDTPRTALVYPVLLRDRPVCLLYADNGEAPVSPRRLGDLLLLLSIVGPAFERILRDRKRRRPKRLPEASPVPEVEVPPPAVETPVPPEPALEPSGAAPAPVEAAVPEEPSAEAGWSAVEPAAVPYPAPPPPAAREAAPVEESWFVPDAAPAPLAEEDIEVDVDVPPVEEAASAAPPDGTAPELPLALRQAPGEPQDPSARGEPVEPRAAVAALPPPAPPIPQDAAGWVDALGRGAPGSAGRREALRWLLTDPAEALRALCAALPGPPDPEAQDALGALGPLAAAVAAFGSRAVPPLLAVAQDPDPVRRRAAVTILAAAGDPASYPALADRALDPDPDVSAAAAEGLGAHRREHGMRAIPEKLRRALLSGLSSRASGAARALGALRDVDAIPLLVQVLDTPDRATAEAAGAALARITLQRHGSDPRAWLAWWKQNRGRGRAEWLFSGLTHADREVRVAAAAELADAAPPPVTYSPDADPDERENAARTWAGWWSRSGHVL